MQIIDMAMERLERQSNIFLWAINIQRYREVFEFNKLGIREKVVVEIWMLLDIK